MSSVSVGKIIVDPAKNPAVLDTATWDIAAVKSCLEKVSAAAWESLFVFLRDGRLGKEYSVGEITFYLSSAMAYKGNEYVLCKLPDQQFVMVVLFLNSREATSSGLEDLVLVGRTTAFPVGIYPADYDSLYTIITSANPLKGPRSLGRSPRVGIGSRNSMLAWPAAYSAMKKGGFAANTIQNSMREIGTLEEVSGEVAAGKSYLFGFGDVPPAYTGGTFEGVWTYGVIHALCSGNMPVYGADADHLQLHSDAHASERMWRVLDAARNYTFYTMDISQIADYGAMFCSSCSGAVALLEDMIPDGMKRRDILSFHKQFSWFNGRDLRYDDAQLGRLIGKYWSALDKLEESYRYIERGKKGEPFDFELTVDEVPPGINPHEIITSEEEMLFLINETVRRGIRISHIAPNFGVEKTTDYRGPDGLAGLYTRIERLHAVAEQYGVMLDCHSGDDLSEDTRRVFGKATRGNIHFKISPSIGDLFAETLFDYDRDKFMVWWDDTLDFARNCSREGSELARRLLEQRDRLQKVVDPHDFLFKEFKFTLPGRKDKTGQLSNREFFYDLPEDFKDEFSARVEKWILDVSSSIFNQ